MRQVADSIYAELIEGIVLLGANPVECAAIWSLQVFSALLAIAFLTRLVVQFIAASRLHSRAEAWSDRDLLSVYDDCVRGSGLNVKPPLLIAPEHIPPAFTSGTLRPRVFISPQLVERLDQAALRTVLLHELAHVARRDNLRARFVHTFSIVIVAVIFPALALAFLLGHHSVHFGSFNAKLLILAVAAMILAVRFLIWWPLRVARELSCDDEAVAAGADPLDLAAALGAAWRLQHERIKGGSLSFGHGLSAFDARVQRRIERLLDYRQPVMLPLLRKAARSVAIVALALSVLFVVDFHHRSATSGKEPLRWSNISPP